ncbi:MAG: pyridoxal-phosphate dependent enzyme [bacterium]|nr:pyridoxal-phosphate dependent enzyme [bacterium]
MNKPKLVLAPTPLHPVTGIGENRLYIKRDDMTGIALGGNKARKLEYYLADAREGNYDHIVTYGTAQSNHCRTAAIAAAMWGLPCTLILAQGETPPLYNGNYFLFDFMEAEIIWTAVDQVSATIDREMGGLSARGKKPYFIPGGGHGYWGAHAYLQAYRELKTQEKELNHCFDYIFFASGTGSTQAGLIIGNKLHASGSEKITGISIARGSKRGSAVIEENINEYIEKAHLDISLEKKDINFIDDYVGDGYGHIYPELITTIKQVAATTGLMLDPVYTGKAFHGMLEHLKKHSIKNKKVLFIHTGGLPLLFYYSEKFKTPPIGNSNGV